ncbi:seryl-tRNA synthetase, putative [Ichthyophthirius multifiliis]|uniref:serine--tRNA ligase n=1 Tax=Ichthyophthirius multifiliis TaxID=5932 RepID=G0QNA6_ICHMU|nr:seryl-tRNA synthetase, putative [Ichthyophthirius multifiliis]EGR33298.1 seryl-tRNA synthetase, putative [Ichthyophthirius multifiliis]|eukprot:XP_004037284.1 seryl-tRNA synthetase, putative [Ichthyophthirius multifiliis]
MGLDINEFRPERGGNPNKVRESQKKRNAKIELVDEVIALDKGWVKTQFNYEAARKELNEKKKLIGERKKANKNDTCDELMKEKEEIEQKIEQLQQINVQAKLNLDEKLKKIGNIVHDTVPVDNNEDNNRIERTWGEKRILQIDETPGKAHHHQILYMLDGFDQKRGSKVVGHRGYYLKNYGVILVQALLNFGQQFLMKKAYTPIQTPFFMKKSIMAETCQLSDFDDQLYKVECGKPEESKEGKTEQTEDFYLIATSEQPISAYHGGEYIDNKELPIRYAGLSSCFRKEAGAAGKETWGIYRVHQFEKIEQFVLCKPEDSWQELENMIKISEEFMQALGLPYRIVNIVSGALNDAAAKKYDLEAWFPGYSQYKELVSCSNCTDFQSRGLNVTTGDVKDKKAEKVFVHMLNGTLCAAQRTLTCILENYQEKDGVRVPQVLQPFVGVDFIPYRQGMPKKNEFQ